MGAPAYQSFIPVQNGLDFNAPKKSASVAIAPKSEVNVDEILGLTDSAYDGMKSVGDTGYFMNDGKLFEAYTPSPVSYYRNSIGGPVQVTGQFGMPYQPSYSIGGELAGGVFASGGADAGTIYKGDQAFRPVTSGSVEGFVEGEDGLELSQAYINANKPKYQGRPQQNLFPLLSLATIPEQNIDPSTSYGAARFLSGDSLDMLSRADETQDFSNATANAALASAGGK